MPPPPDGADLYRGLEMDDTDRGRQFGPTDVKFKFLVSAEGFAIQSCMVVYV